MIKASLMKPKKMDQLIEIITHRSNAQRQEILQAYNNQNEINYSQNDPLEAIGYSAEPGDIYYMNPPKQLSTYPMYIEKIYVRLWCITY